MNAQLQSMLKVVQGKDLDDKVDATLDQLLVAFGSEILKIVPGKVSTEVDARFSFDTKASVDKALHIIEVRSCPLALCHSADSASCTNNLGSERRESSSKLPRPGRAFKLRVSCNHNMASTATLPSCSL